MNVRDDLDRHITRLADTERRLHAERLTCEAARRALDSGADAAEVKERLRAQGIRLQQAPRPPARA